MALPTQRIFGIAEEQWGLVTRRQAASAGVAPTTFGRQVKDGRLKRVCPGVYRVRGAAEPDHLELRAAWLALDPGKPAWARLDDPDVALVSHASAADLYGVGDLRADVHEFTLPVRRQTRRSDVRLHRGYVPPELRTIIAGLPVTNSARMIGDLLADRVDPIAVGQIASEVLGRNLTPPAAIAECMTPHASAFGFRRGDGEALLDHLLELVGSEQRAKLVDMVRGA